MDVSGLGVEPSPNDTDISYPYPPPLAPAPSQPPLSPNAIPGYLQVCWDAPDATAADLFTVAIVKGVDPDSLRTLSVTEAAVDGVGCYNTTVAWSSSEVFYIRVFAKDENALLGLGGEAAVITDASGPDQGESVLRALVSIAWPFSVSTPHVDGCRHWGGLEWDGMGWEVG